MTAMWTAGLILIVLMVLIAVLRMIIGPTIWDRLLSLNVITSKVLVAIVILARLLDLNYLLDIALIYAVLGFLSTVLIARFIERRGDL